MASCRTGTNGRAAALEMTFITYSHRFVVVASVTNETHHSITQQSCHILKKSRSCSSRTNQQCVCSVGFIEWMKENISELETTVSSTTTIVARITTLLRKVRHIHSSSRNIIIQSKHTRTHHSCQQ